MVRQGDVLVRKVDALPKSAVQDGNTEKVILAYGEVTGHHHRIEAGAKKYVDPETQCTYIEIAEALAALDHEEHSTLTLPAGIHEVIIQRGFSRDMVRTVKD